MTYRDIYFCLIGILIGAFVVFTLFHFEIPPSQKNENAYDEAYAIFFQILDKTVIHKAGSTEIGSIVNESLTIENDAQRLNKIAELITNNYNDKVVGDKPPYLPNSQRYRYDENGHIWVTPTINDSHPNLALIDRNLESDPNWLIYQKIGACKELSIIFNDITKKAGFSSRIIRTGDSLDSNGSGATHWWNEAVIDGVNKTFDVQWYFQNKNSNKTSSTWSGNRTHYINNSDSFSPQQLCSWGGVWITNSLGNKIEDVTSDYMNSYNCKNYNRNDS